MFTQRILNVSLFFTVRCGDGVPEGWLGDEFVATINPCRHLGLHRDVVHIYWPVQQYLAHDSSGSCVCWNGRNAVYDAHVLVGTLPDSDNGNPRGCGY